MQDYDKIKNDSEPLIEDNNYVFHIPPKLNFKDINSSSIIHLQENFHATYFNALNLPVNNETGTSMYNQQYLLSVRLGQDSTHYYINGRVKSAHFSRLVYSVHLKLSIQYALIEEAQCECKSGKGPTANCKHIYVVIEALKDFIKTRKIKTRETCTSQLQTFHKPKAKYTGSPVKTKSIELKRSKLMIEERGLNFDPRPLDSRNNATYPQHFRNLCISYAAQNQKSFLLLHLFQSANIRACYLDHDYETESPQTKFLQSLNILQISEIKRDEIELSTRGQSDSKEWILERSFRLNSSMFGRICKCNDKNKMVQELLNPNDISHLPAIKHGKFYESYAVKKFEDLTNQQTSAFGTFVSLQNPFLAASPDRILNKEFCVEVQCPYSAKDSFISPETVDYLYLNPENGLISLKKDHNYYYQVEGQMYCTDLKWCYFIVYTLKDILVIGIERDENFIQAMIRNLSNFFHEFYMEAILDKYFYKYS